MDDSTLMRDMSDTQRILFQTAMQGRRKSVGIAAVLCILGPIGTHRFYLGQIGRGLVMLALTLTGVGLVVTIPWALFDLVGIRKLVAGVNTERERVVASQIRSFDAPHAASCLRVDRWPPRPDREFSRPSRLVACSF